MTKMISKQLLDKNEQIRIKKFKETLLDKLEVAEPTEFMDYLVTSGYFHAPASKKYNGNHAGGLYEHSLSVTDALIELTVNMDIQWQNKRSPYLIGLFHDLCKMDEYLWINDGPNGQYINNPNMLIQGHGDKSISLLTSWFTLTPEEVLCIGYHMGPYTITDQENYGKAIQTYSTVLWTHTADMIASKIKNT